MTSKTNNNPLQYPYFLKKWFAWYLKDLFLCQIIVDNNIKDSVWTYPRIDFLIIIK